MPPMSPSDLSIELDGSVASVRLTRADKRNALHLELVNRIGQFFAEPPPEIRAAVLLGEGTHFCAGLDLAENRDRTVFQAMENSSAWHRAFDHIERGRIPVVAALHGAVIGGGLELALAAHVRVADSSAFYSLPEGRLGIFVGGGGSVRIARVLGADRMREMMLTGRRLTAEDGQRLGISHEFVADGEAARQAQAIALQIAGNAPLANQLILAALPRIGDMSSSDGLWAEALAAAVSQSTEDAIEGMRAFLEKRPPDFRGA
jgi:enoyl-CoA hydratase/carnithine racemase